jgi:hypothetical protein
VAPSRHVEFFPTLPFNEAAEPNVQRCHWRSGKDNANSYRCEQRSSRRHLNSTQYCQPRLNEPR